MDKRSFATLQDGINLSLPRAFSAMVKPVGSACNLGCVYCYYLDKERFYGRKQPLMPLDLLEKYIKETIEANDVPEITFTWHGGEPLLAPESFYHHALAFERKYNRQNKKIGNALQTNGTLLNDSWCRFFKKNKFLIGLSLDGPAYLHDVYRRNKAQEPSFLRVMKGLKLLQQYGVDFNTLTVVNNVSASHGGQLYDFLKDQGVRYMQFLPAVDYIEPSDTQRIIADPTMINNQKAVMAPWSVGATQYGQFLIDVFNKWVVRDVGTCFVQLFDMTLTAWYGMDPPLCAYSPTCGRVPVVEHNGDVYSCDHFVYPEYKIGNLRTDTMADMMDTPAQFQFGLDKRNTLSRECLRCPWYFACRGECPKHRHLPTLDGERKFTLCEGLKMFYKHVDPYMKYMCDLLKRELPPAHVMPFARVAMGQE